MIKRAITGLGLGIAALFPAVALASPFVPKEWRREVKSGALAKQNKHLKWARDHNDNFVDDAIDALPEDQTTRVIVQLNQALDPSEARARFAGFGKIRHIGVLVAYVAIEEVPVCAIPDLAADPVVAAVEVDRQGGPSLDISTRGHRARASVTYSPSTCADAFGLDGRGVNIAIVDSGVDDTQHIALPGKFVSGYNALIGQEENPDDDNTGVTTGQDGICNSAAVADDVQWIPVGQGASSRRCILPGSNGVLDSIPAGDDFAADVYIYTGPNGICETAALGDDVQLVPVGRGVYDGCISAGPDGILQSTRAGDDERRIWFHGTHVAGIALGVGGPTGCRVVIDGSTPSACAGMAPGAGLVDVKVYDPFNRWYFSDLIAALEWIWLDGRADVVNLSLAETSQSDGTDAVSQVIDALVSRGIPVAVSAGNTGNNTLGVVAAASLAITAGSARNNSTVGRDDDGLSSFTSIGPRVDFDPDDPNIAAMKPDLAAYGDYVVSAFGNTTNSYHALTGTSMSAPHVAGAMALLLQLRPDIPPGSLKNLLKYSSYITPQHAAAGPSYPGVDSRYNVRWGYGLLDVYQAALMLQTGGADVGFPSCADCNQAYPLLRPCVQSADPAAGAAPADIRLQYEAIRAGRPNTIHVTFQNHSVFPAEHVTVCVGVGDAAVGVGQFDTLGCKDVTLGAHEILTLDFPWTPSATDQTIRAALDYGPDRDFCNNVIERTVRPLDLAGPIQGSFRIENPFPEPAVIEWRAQVVRGDPGPATLAVSPSRGQAHLAPGDKAREIDLQITSASADPAGPVTVFVSARAFLPSRPEGIELSGFTLQVHPVSEAAVKAQR